MFTYSYFLYEYFFSHTDNVGPLTALQHASVQSGRVTRFFVKMERPHHTASSTGLGPIPWMLAAKLFARVQRLDTVGSR